MHRRRGRGCATHRPSAHRRRGFGAINPLRVVARHAEPRVIERLRADLSATVTALSGRLDALSAREQRAGDALESAETELAARNGGAFVGLASSRE